MIEQVLWRFLESGKRKQAVIIGTILTGLVAVWPAADEYMAAGERVREAQSKLEESRQEVDKLPQYTQVFEKRQTELEKLEQQVVDERTAQNLQGQLRQLVRDAKCGMRTVRLGNATQRDWSENDSPINWGAVKNRGSDTPFRLATRHMSISITGAMPNISTFLQKLHEIDRLVHTKKISLKRVENEQDILSLDMDILLFDLFNKSET